MLRLTALPAIAVLSLALAACQRDAPSAAPPTAAPALPAGSASVVLDQPDAHATGTRAPQVVDGVVTFEGFGPARFGTDQEQVRIAWGHDLGDAQPSEPGGCYYLSPQPPRTDDGTPGFMIEGDRFARIDVGNPGYTAPGGGKVGMSRAEIEQLYADRVEAAPHKYVEGAQTLRVTDPEGGASVLVFETDAEGRVTAWRIGVPPQVDYVERCG
ncbi:lectin [Luteimonas sp. 3794]|uniref:lectin n=1 Tax=Luteimonas sp. 3794 TaxID=2817730 RepID=UPI0028666103|nr:lectin [Luteimonas sp. 3794]MDR6991803.1 hypothetical protein [Luteimonas sp. 3794]